MEFNVNEYTKQLIDKMINIIGYLTWYNLSSKVRHETYAKAFSFAGLPENFEIKPVQPWQAMRRAANEFERETKGEGFADLFYNEADVSKVALISREKQLEKDHIDYEHQTTLILNKVTGKLKIRGSFQVETFKKLYKGYREYHNHTDIRRIVIDFLNQECQAHSVREHGGIYFVPVTFTENMVRLEAFISKLGNKSCFYILPIENSNQARSEIHRIFSEHIETEIVRYNELLDKVTQKRYRTREMKGHLEEFKKLLKKVETYEDLLKYKNEDAKNSIMVLEKKVKRFLREGEKRDVKLAEDRKIRKREQARKRREREKAERIASKNNVTIPKKEKVAKAKRRR